MAANKKRLTTNEILNRYVVEGTCHIYTGFKNKCGYGVITTPNNLGEPRLHRLSYKYHKGQIGDKHVLHKCDNPGCINPDHLFLGTHQDNMIDKADKGRVKTNPGEANGRAKLTEADVIQIRNMKANKVSRTKISEHFGVSVHNIDAITYGNTWRHVK